MSADMDPETDMDALAQIAAGIAQRLRTDDRNVLLDQLAQLCHQHPVKAAQLVMVFAAWHNPDEPVSALWARVESIPLGRSA